jgi:PAS domain S-box-containing protein
MRNDGMSATRILAVDDNSSALYATARVLRSAGYEVIEASTGAAALAAAPRADLVVLDVNLPDIDGFEVCRRLRANPETASLPVLHLSATFTNSSDFVQGFEAGADSYLTRPVEPPVLIATVRTLLFARQADTFRRGSDAKLQTMFNLAPVAIAILDHAFHYESVNAAFCTLTGYAAEDLKGQPGDMVLKDPSTVAWDDALGATGGHWSEHLTIRKKNGDIAKVEWQIATERISGVRILTVTDITRQVQAENAREHLLESERAARAAAERSNRMKEEFLATLSHELRNPLNAILGWATVLSRKPDLSDSIRDGLKAIERNSRIQAQMIADLLDHAGITFGKMRLVAETIDPYPIVRAALDVVNTSADHLGVSVLPRFDQEALKVDADPARLHQIVTNLLSNAVKFSNRGSQVDLEAGREANFFRVSVTDYGRGIDPDFLPRIFERFSQQDATTTRSHGGLGLGLAIVKQLTDLLGGSIEAFSDGPGKGARFTVKIPLSENAAAPDVSESQLMRGFDFSGVRALVVEDDEDARSLTRRILTELGATVIEAQSASDALAQVASANANILISDIGMAQQDGYQLIRQLRSSGYGPDVLPAIALTAFARMEDRSEALAAGFQEHLIKPLDPQLLVARVARLSRRPPSRKNPT